jgi:hypothetical protein
MTKKQFRKMKAQRLSEKSKFDELANERPMWANDEKFDEHERTWKQKFLDEVKNAIYMRDQPQYA